jgi:hypothetical protein
MNKVTFVLLLFASPALAQTPNLAPAPPMDRVGNPALCLPIGKTSKGDLVYSLDCRDIPIAAGVNNEPQPVAPTVPPRHRRVSKSGRCRAWSFVPLQFPLSPMLLFARRIEHPFDVSVQCPHHSDMRMHRRPPIFRRHDQGLAAAGQRNWIRCGKAGSRRWLTIATGPRLENQSNCHEFLELDEVVIGQGGGCVVGSNPLFLK